MKTYYSIVSISTNPSLNEKFNIGLICVTPNDTFFHFSETKFKIISKLLSPNAIKLAFAALQGIEKNFQPVTSEINVLFSEDKKSLASKPYLNYLSRYNNNLIQFSDATNIDLEIDFNVFKALFKKYIYTEEIFEPLIKSKTSLFSTTRKLFKKSAEQYANINFPVSNDIIKDLMVPVTVDVFGKNGSFVSSQTVDFSKSYAALQGEITSYLYLVDHTEKVDKESKCFILGDEPSKNDNAQHSIWKSVRDSKLVEVVPFDESEKIIDYMKAKEVAPIVK